MILLLCSILFCSSRSFAGSEMANSVNSNSASPRLSSDLSSLPLIKWEGAPGKLRDGQCKLENNLGELSFAIIYKVHGEETLSRIGEVPGKLIQPDMKLTEGFKKTITENRLSYGSGTKVSAATYKDGILRVEMNLNTQDEISTQTWVISVGDGSLKNIKEIKVETIRRFSIGEKIPGTISKIHCGQASS